MSPSESHVEMLSAYLDGELPNEESTRVEKRLECDPELRRQLAGLRSITSDLAHLERLAPPSTLGQDVARRIALAGEKKSLLDRIENGLSGAQQQSNIFLMFAVILALATIMYFFSEGLERNKLTPVVFNDPAGAPNAAEIDAASTIFVAERFFQRQGELWIEEGLSEQEIAVARLIDLEKTPAWIVERPELRGIALLGRAVFRLDGEIVELSSKLESPPTRGPG